MTFPFSFPLSVTLPALPPEMANEGARGTAALLAGASQFSVRRRSVFPNYWPLRPEFCGKRHLVVHRMDGSFFGFTEAATHLARVGHGLPVWEDALRVAGQPEGEIIRDLAARSALIPWFFFSAKEGRVLCFDGTTLVADNLSYLQGKWGRKTPRFESRHVVVVGVAP